jgi:PAS domain S-box-containing protein
MSIILVVAGSTLSYIEFATLPRFADDAQVLGSLQALGLAWTGVCAFLSTTLNADANRGHASAMLLYVGFPGLAAVSAMAVRARYGLVVLCDPHRLEAPAQFVILARAMLWHWLGQVHMNGHDCYVEETPAICKTRDEVFRNVQHVFELGVDRFPHSAHLRTCLARFFTDIVDNRVLAYGELQASEPYASGLDLLFARYRLRSKLDKLTEATLSKEVRAYLEFKTRKEDADAAMITATRLLVDFWTQLLRKEPEVDSLSRISHNARRLLMRASAHYDRLLDINPVSVPVLRTYGSIVLDIFGDVPRALAMFERAETAEILRAKAIEDKMESGDLLQRLTTNLDIFDERNAVFGITLDKDAFGLIETINPAARKLFGYYQSTDLVGNNVSMLIPSPLAEVHDKLLSDYLVRKTSRIVNQTRVTYGIHRLGYLLPVNLYVRWADEAAGKMVGVLQSIEQPRDVHFLVDPTDWTVRHSSKNALKFFGLRRSHLADTSVKLPHLLPELQRRDVTLTGIAAVDADAKDEADAEHQRNWQQIATRTGLIGRARHYDTQHSFAVRSWSQPMSAGGADLIFVRVLVYEPTEDDDVDYEGNSVYNEDDVDSFATAYQQPNSPLDDDTDEEGSAAKSRSHLSVTPLSLAGLVEKEKVRTTPPKLGSAQPAASRRTLLALHPPVSGATAGSTRSLLKPSVSQRRLDTGGVAAETPLATPPISSTPPPPSPLGMSDSTRALLRLAQAQRSTRQLDLSVTCASAPLSSAIIAPSSSPLITSPPAGEAETPIAGLQKRRDAAARMRAGSKMNLSSSAFNLGASAAALPSMQPPPGRSGVRVASVRSNTVESEEVRSHPSSVNSGNTSDLLGLNDRCTRAYGQSRLVRAIERENRQTERGITLMSRFAHIVVYAIIALCVVSYIVTTSYLDDASADAHVVLQSANRNAALMEASFVVRTITMLNNDSHETLYDVPIAIPEMNLNNVLSQLLQRLDTTVAMVRDTSLGVDAAPSINAALHSLRNNPVVEVANRVGSMVVTELVSLREGFTKYLTYVMLGKALLTQLLTSNPNYIADMSVYLPFFPVANGPESLRDASDLYTLTLRRGMSDKYSTLLLANCMIFVAAALSTLFVILVFIRPIAVRIERSKSEVLDMFLDIKRPVRRALRRQVHAVLIMMTSSGENEEQQPDDDADAAADNDNEHWPDSARRSEHGSGSGNGSGTGSSCGSSGDRTALSDLAAAAAADASVADPVTAAAAAALTAGGDSASGDKDKDKDKGKDNAEDGTPRVQGAPRVRGGTAHSRYLMRIARKRAARRHAIATGADTSGDEAALDTSKPSDHVGSGERPARMSALDAMLASYDGSGTTSAAQGDGKGGVINLSSLPSVTHPLDRSATQKKLAFAFLTAVDREKLALPDAAAPDEEQRAPSNHSILARLALQALIVRLALFVAILVSYGIMMCVLTNQTTNFVEQYSATLDVAARRVPTLQRAFFNARESLFGRYEDVVAAHPNWPTTRGGNFITAGRAFMEDLMHLNYAIRYGNKELGLGQPGKFAAQETLYSDNACNLPADDRAARYMLRSLPEWYNRQCDTIANGMLTGGLNQGLLFALTQLDSLLLEDQAGAFGPWQANPGNADIPLGSAASATLITKFRDLSQFISYFLAIGYWRSSALYLVQIFEKIEAFNLLRLILILCFSILLFLYYLFGVRPVTLQLALAARQTHAMMLILPPEVAKSIPSVQAYIVNNRRNRN